jgi:hypothetical protein
VGLPFRFWPCLLTVANIEARGSVSGHSCERTHKAGIVARGSIKRAMLQGKRPGGGGGGHKSRVGNG